MRSELSALQSQRLWQLFEAIGTAVYAFRIGAPEFENQGHRMLAESLTLLRG